MGLILDSSVVVAAERRGENPTELVEQIAAAIGFKTQRFLPLV
jgi:hypothetical protein